MTWEALCQINMGWYGQVVEIFAGLFPKFHTYSLLESYEFVHICKYMYLLCIVFFIESNKVSCYLYSLHVIHIDPNGQDRRSRQIYMSPANKKHSASAFGLICYVKQFVNYAI